MAAESEEIFLVICLLYFYFFSNELDDIQSKTGVLRWFEMKYQDLMKLVELGLHIRRWVCVGLPHATLVVVEDLPELIESVCFVVLLLKLLHNCFK